MTEEDTKQVAVFPCKANPPHFGLILELFYAADLFEHVFVAVYNKSSVIPVERAIQLLEQVLSKYGDGSKFTVIACGYDFSKIDSMPTDYVNMGVTMVVTPSEKIFANFVSKSNKNIVKLRRAVGWHDIYEQIAFTRGYVLDSLRAKFRGM